MDNGRLMLTRRKGESVEVFTADEHIKITILAIHNKSILGVTGDNRSFELSPGGAPMTLGLGMTLQLKDCSFGQCKLAFHGPKSVTVLRSELRPKVPTALECPGCGHRVGLEARAAGRFDFDCAGCQQFTISQYREV